MIDLNNSRNLAVRRRAGCFHVRFLLPMLISSLGLMLVGQVMAQTFKTLYSFTATPPYPGPYTNSDGAVPSAGLFLSGDTLYGTTALGGSPGQGTVFKVSTDGTAFTHLYSFGFNGVGRPYASLISSGDRLYGTTLGTVFKVNLDGTGFTTLLSFNYSDGGASGLVVLSNTVYGKTQGGFPAAGTVFKVNLDGTGFTILHRFNNNDVWWFPQAGLILSGNTLYGTRTEGDNNGYGTVFAINTDGTAFTNLHNFTATQGVAGTNSDGAGPVGGLILSGNTLYGTTPSGGSSGYGTVFALNIDATGFKTLHSFTAASFDTDTKSLSYLAYTNSDGTSPVGGLILSGNTLYGTTQHGGNPGAGTVFAVNTDGTGFKTLHSFTGFGEGGGSVAGLIVSGNTLYGTAAAGGFGSGTIFSISFTPQLSITPSGLNVILSWPTNYAGFDYTGYKLQSTTNLASPIWTTNLPAPVVVNGLNTVTNSISGTKQFFRLSQ